MNLLNPTSYPIIISKRKIHHQRQTVLGLRLALEAKHVSVKVPCQGTYLLVNPQGRPVQLSEV